MQRGHTSLNLWRWKQIKTASRRRWNLNSVLKELCWTRRWGFRAAWWVIFRGTGLHKDWEGKREKERETENASVRTGPEGIQHESYSTKRNRAYGRRLLKSGMRSGHEVHFEPGSLDIILKIGREMGAFGAEEWSLQDFVLEGSLAAVYRRRCEDEGVGLGWGTLNWRGKPDKMVWFLDKATICVTGTVFQAGKHGYWGCWARSEWWEGMNAALYAWVPLWVPQLAKEELLTASPNLGTSGTMSPAILVLAFETSPGVERMSQLPCRLLGRNGGSMGHHPSVFAHCLAELSKQGHMPHHFCPCPWMTLPLSAFTLLTHIILVIGKECANSYVGSGHLCHVCLGMPGQGAYKTPKYMQGCKGK